MKSILLIALCLSQSADPAPPDGKLKIFILAGQSNMEGKGDIGVMEYQLTQERTKARFDHLRKNGKWIVRDDVWIKFLDRKGRLTVGFGSRNRFGPELEFGIAVGDKLKEPVLIIKTAWGGKSLFRDFRPPSSGFPGREELQKMADQENARNIKRGRPANATPATVKARYGLYYRKMMKEVDAVLKNLKEYCPSYKGQGYEIAGFVWFQGWNDMINDKATAKYTKNMVNFINDVRRDLKAPDMPFIIGEMGVGGVDEKSGKKVRFKKAQSAAADVEEFKGNVAVVKTDQFWDLEADKAIKVHWNNKSTRDIKKWRQFGNDRGYHYYGSPVTFSRIGRAFGEKMLKLMGR